MVHPTLVVDISKGAGCVVHSAEVIEETPQGIQGLHVVSRFYLSTVICTGRLACNDIKRSLPKGLIESVLEVNFEQSPGLVWKVLLAVKELQDLRGEDLFLACSSQRD